MIRTITDFINIIEVFYSIFESSVYYWFLLGDICPSEFDYQFGTCSKRFEGEEIERHESMCKKRTMGTGKAFLTPHVSNTHYNIIFW